MKKPVCEKCGFSMITRDTFYSTGAKCIRCGGNIVEGDDKDKGDD